MAKNLVIIESPPKAHTIQACLGPDYKVVASKGHVRDLPVSSLGIDIENGFEPHYINIRGKGDLINELRREAKSADKVYLATDPDREGEAISWHLAGVLNIPAEKVSRVTFNELTRNVISTSINNPRPIDMNLVNAQQARRILDRIVGYKLSPMLWKRVKNGLSAGRVQSVATRMVVEREEAIRAFVPEEYWTVSATLSADGNEFPVRFFGDLKGNKLNLTCLEEAQKAENAAKTQQMKVKSLKHGVKYRMPAPPFTTSTLQQEASRKLNFQSARTMKTAQELYEGINLSDELGGMQGLITYMRTDSLRISEEAAASAKEYITGKYGPEYAPEKQRQYKTSANIQDAHEAIRPARVELLPQKIKSMVSSDQYKLYKLIWERFVASQMESAALDTVSADFECGDYTFRTGGYTVTFPGFLALYEESTDASSKRVDDCEDIKDIRIPELKEGDCLKSIGTEAVQHHTEPPLRYTEASLIRELEEKGIGRPSTITPTITTIISREYVQREGKSLLPTKLGEVTTQLMREDFGDIVDYSFTAGMETQLDSVAAGNTDMLSVLDNFWKSFELELEAEEEKMNNGDGKKIQAVEETDMICEKCGAKMVVRKGRFGKFAACPNYPECKNTKPLSGDAPAEKAAPVIAEGEKCPDCGGDLVQRKGPYGLFLACSNFPKCRYIKREDKFLDVLCPDCGGKILIRQSRKKTLYYSCEHYPDCKFSSWDLPTNEKCPECGSMLFRKEGRKAGLYCHKEGCNWSKEDEKAQKPAYTPEMPPLPDDSDAPAESDN